MSLKNTLYSCGVSYDIVSNIPKVQPLYMRTSLPVCSIRPALGSSALSEFLLVSVQASEEPEERETLALMAARGDSEETQDGETYIEKYTRGVLEVENILSLERLRQVL